MEKLKYLLIAMFLMIMPCVNAESKYAKIEDITNADTLRTEKNGVITGNETANTTLTYKQGTFKLLDTNDEGRPKGYAWIGIKVKVPEKATNIKFEGSNKDEKDFDVYYGFNPDKLEESLNNGISDCIKTFTLTYTLESEEISQKIKVVIEPAYITLLDEDEDNEVWNNKIYNEIVEKLLPDETDKDESPTTGIIDYTFLATILSITSLGTYLIIKKRFN